MRKYWIDYLRCIAIVAVIIIHSTTPFYARFNEIGQLDWWFANVLNSASRFAVPLFVMISGALLLGRNLTIAEFYKKRAVRLLPALIVWNLFYFSLKVYRGEGSETLVGYLIKSFFTGGAAVHLWYLSMFVCLMLFTPFLNKFINGDRATPGDLRTLLVFLFFFFLLNGIASVAWEIWDIETIWFRVFPWYMAYFVGGYYIDRYSDSISIKSGFILLVLVFLILAGAALNYYFITAYKIVEDNLIFTNTGPMIFLMTIIIFLLAKRNTGVLKKNKYIASVSEASFGMYLIHPVFLHLLEERLPMYFSNALISIPLTICFTTLASFYSIIFLRRFSFMKKIS